MESWPVGEPFALRPHTQRITLAVILRAVFGVHDEERFGALRRLIDDFAARVDAGHRASRCCAATSAASAPGRASCAPARRSTSSSTRRSPLRRAEVDGGERARRRALAAAAGPRTRTATPMSDARAARRAGHGARRRPRDDRDRRSPGRSSGCCARRAVLARLRESIAAGEDDYLDATIKETLRVAAGDRRRRAQADRAGRDRRLRAAGRAPSCCRRSPRMHYREDLFPEPERVPPRALPRRQGRHLRLDPVRRRRAPLHRRRLRRVRDAGRPARDPRARRAAAPPTRRRRRSRSATSPWRPAGARGSCWTARPSSSTQIHMLGRGRALYACRPGKGLVSATSWIATSGCPETSSSMRVAKLWR